MIWEEVAIVPAGLLRCSLIVTDHIGYICLFQVIMKRLRASIRSHRKLSTNHERRKKCALSSSQAKPSAPAGKELALAIMSRNWFHWPYKRADSGLLCNFGPRTLGIFLTVKWNNFIYVFLHCLCGFHGIK